MVSPFLAYVCNAPMRVAAVTVLLWGLACGLAVPVVAQTATATTGAVNGTVTDSSNALLPGTTITLAGPSLMVVRTARTDAAGAYRFAAVPPGEYTLTFDAPAQSFTEAIAQPPRKLRIAFTANYGGRVPVDRETRDICTREVRKFEAAGCIVEEAFPDLGPAEDVFLADPGSLTRNFVRWTRRLASGGAPAPPEVRGLVDTRPLYHTLQRVTATVDGELIGIQHNLDRGNLRAIALTALNYSNGQTVVWAQGADLDPWDDPRRQTFRTRITADHVMASASLPLFFPAVRLGDSWYGDGGVRLATPLAPALRLGAQRILAISPRYRRSH